MKEFVVHLSHRPGELARVTNAPSPVGVNIKSIAAMAVGEQGIVRFIPDDAAPARRGSKTAGCGSRRTKSWSFCWRTRPAS